MTAYRSVLLSRKLVSKLKKSTSSYNWGRLFRECKTTNLGVGSSNLPERAIPQKHTLQADKRSRPGSCVVDGSSLSTGSMACHSKSVVLSDRGVTSE